MTALLRVAQPTAMGARVLQLSYSVAYSTMTTITTTTTTTTTTPTTTSPLTLIPHRRPRACNRVVESWRRQQRRMYNGRPETITLAELHTYYEVLGLPVGSSFIECNKKYFSLAKNSHPDSGKKDPKDFIKEADRGLAGPQLKNSKDALQDLDRRGLKEALDAKLLAKIASEAASYQRQASAEVERKAKEARDAELARKRTPAAAEVGRKAKEARDAELARKRSQAVAEEVERRARMNRGENMRTQKDTVPRSRQSTAKAGHEKKAKTGAAGGASTAAPSSGGQMGKDKGTARDKAKNPFSSSSSASTGSADNQAQKATGKSQAKPLKSLKHRFSDSVQDGVSSDASSDALRMVRITGINIGIQSWDLFKALDRHLPGVIYDYDADRRSAWVEFADSVDAQVFVKLITGSGLLIEGAPGKRQRVYTARLEVADAATRPYLGSPYRRLEIWAPAGNRLWAHCQSTDAMRVHLTRLAGERGEVFRPRVDASATAGPLEPWNPSFNSARDAEKAYRLLSAHHPEATIRPNYGGLGNYDAQAASGGGSDGVYATDTGRVRPNYDLTWTEALMRFLAIWLGLVFVSELGASELVPQMPELETGMRELRTREPGMRIVDDIVAGSSEQEQRSVRLKLATLPPWVKQS